MAYNIYSYIIKGLLHWYRWILSLFEISTDPRKLAPFDIRTLDNIHRYQCYNPIISHPLWRHCKNPYVEITDDWHVTCNRKTKTTIASSNKKSQLNNIFQSSREEWRNVFYACAGIDVFGLIVFLSFGSGKVQGWAQDTQREDASQHKTIALSASVCAQRDRARNVASQSRSSSSTGFVRVNSETVRSDLTKEMNMKLKYGVVNLAFEIEPVEETAVWQTICI